MKKKTDLNSIKRKFSIIGWGMTAQILIGLALSLIVQFLLLRLVPDFMNNPILILLAGTIPLWVATVLSYQIFKKVPILEEKKTKLPFSFLAKAFFVSVFLMYCGSIIGTLVNGATGVNINPVTDVILKAPWWLRVLLTVIGAPIIEELLFRKILIDRMKIHGEFIAIMISAIMFGLYHGNFSQLFYAFGVGLVLGYVYVRSNNVKYSMGIHMIINAMGTILAPLATGYDIDALVNSLQEISITSDIALLEDFIMNHQSEILRLAALEIAVMAIIAFFITGLVIFCKNIGKVQFNKIAKPIPKQHRFKTICLNYGMIICFITFIGYFVFQML